ncbi:MAG: methyltransferase domain-containing protein [Dehalococcoidales bacterium]|nr:MAG: methyltransferase domain-containing protein [Dehalococcoidales bacterium]
MASRHGGYDYREFVAEYYDAAYETARQKDIDFFVDYSLRAGGRMLELGCGTGRVLIPTAAAGCEITGLDISSYMLNICREKLSQQPEEVQERVKLVQGDMTDFDTGETYSLVTTPFRPFQHLITVDEQKSCLNCVNRHLITGGLLILDLFYPRFQRLIPDPQYMSEIEDLPEMTLPDGRLFRRTNRTADYHREQQYNDVELIYYITYPDGRQERLVQAFPFRYFFRYEVENLLELCGFGVVDIFGEFDCSPLSGDSPEMIFVAEKRD